jgi:hypothetical protein
MSGAGSATYDAVEHELLADPAVATGVLFGHRCLKFGRKVFACEHDGELLVKLPPDRLAELKAAQGARDFEPMGRRMGGWVKVPEPDGDAVRAWTALADEAKAFVAGTG